MHKKLLIEWTFHCFGVNLQHILATNDTFLYDSLKQYLFCFLLASSQPIFAALENGEREDILGTRNIFSSTGIQKDVKRIHLVIILYICVRDTFASFLKHPIFTPCVFLENIPNNSFLVSSAKLPIFICITSHLHSNLVRSFLFVFANYRQFCWLNWWPTPKLWSSAMFVLLTLCEHWSVRPGLYIDSWVQKPMMWNEYGMNVIYFVNRASSYYEAVKKKAMVNLIFSAYYIQRRRVKAYYKGCDLIWSENDNCDIT